MPPRQSCKKLIKKKKAADNLPKKWKLRISRCYHRSHFKFSMLFQKIKHLVSPSLSIITFHPLQNEQKNSPVFRKFSKMHLGVT